MRRADRRRPSPGRLLLGLAATLALGACRDLERFDTEGESAFCGELVGAPFQTGFLPADAEPDTIGLRLTFDIRGLATSPGEITTNDEAQGLCSPEPLFAAQPLRSVSEAFHDPISMLSFGDGRERNLLVWVDSTCRGTFLGVVSLMRNDEIELRLFKPAPAPSTTTPAADRAGFAVFRLSRAQRGCGF